MAAAYWMYLQAQKTAQATCQVSTPAGPPVALVENGCPASTKDMKIEDAVVNKARSSGPLHAPRTTPAPRPAHSILQSVPRTCEAPPPVPPTPLVDDTALEARSAGVTRSAPSTAVEDHGSVPLDALSALSDTLGAPEPVPEPPKLDPSEIVNEGPVVTEEAEFVGEREDTLPPDYRFPQDGTDLPPAVEDKEPSMDPCAALDILSGDFTSTPATVPAALPKQPCLDALNMLEGDFAAPALSLVGQTHVPEAPLDALQESCTAPGATADPSPADTFISPESDAPDSTPGRLPDYTLEGCLQSTSKKTPELYHNPCPESAPALGPELAHKLLPECALDLNPEPAPESSPELALKPRSESAPDSLEMDPDCTLELTPQSSPESGPDPGPGPALALVQGSAPGSPAELCPESASAPALELDPNLTRDSATKVVLSLVNEVDPASPPKLGPEFTSGQEPLLVPDSIPEPEPAAITDQNKTAFLSFNRRRRPRQTIKPNRLQLTGLLPLSPAISALLPTCPLTYLWTYWMKHQPFLTFLEETWCQLIVKFLQEVRRLAHTQQGQMDREKKEQGSRFHMVYF
ncbi:hypothetical protein GJAV_G00027610 [Gymnothorax javanicus]|nr:hypothetical protein GJAV_G00027610 [Gymnothorax javanicus]